MSAATARVGVGGFFLHARPIRLAGVLVAITAVLLFASVIVQQALTMTGPQVAEQFLGGASTVVQDAGGARLGESTTKDDAALARATKRAGGRDVGVYWNDLGQHPNGATGMNVNLFENDWGTSPSSTSIELMNGRWASGAAEAAVSPALAKRWPVGSHLTFYGDRLSVKVVGVARARFQRDSSDVYLHPHTLTALQVPAAAARRLDAGLQRFIYWNGDVNSRTVVAAVKKVIKQHPSTVRTYSPQVFDRAELVQFAPSMGPAALIGSAVAPFLAALVGGIIATRFANRVRHTLWTIGVSWRRTRAATLAAILGATTAGAIVGTIVGLGVGAIARLVIAPLWTRELGTFSVPWNSILLFLALQLVGASTALVALRGRATRPRKVSSAARRRLSRLSPVLVAVAFASTGTALILIDSGDPVFLSVAAFFYGLVVLAAVPAAFALLARLRPQSMPLLLALRRITLERRSAALSLVAVTTIVLLGFCTSTFLASTFAAFNRSQAEAAIVQPDQLQLAPQTGSRKDDTRVRRAFERETGLSDSAVTRSLEDVPGGLNEAVLTIGSAEQFEAIAHLRLTRAAETTLNGGGALMVSGRPATRLKLAADADRTYVVPAVTVRGIPQTIDRYRAFVLANTARELDLPTGSATYLYGGITPQQRDDARAAAARAGINSGWVTVYRDPPVVEQSIRTALAGNTLAVLAGLLMLIVAITETRNLRPSLAGLRAVGVGSSWLARAVTARSLILASIALALALTGAIAGVAVMLQISGRSYLVDPPVLALATTSGVLLVLALASSAIAGRSLRLTERAL